MYVSANYLGSCYLPDKLGVRDRYLLGKASNGHYGWNEFTVGSITVMRHLVIPGFLLSVMGFAKLLQDSGSALGIVFASIGVLFCTLWIIGMIFGTGWESDAAAILKKKYAGKMFGPDNPGYSTLRQICKSDEVLRHVLENDTLLQDFLGSTVMERHALEVMPASEDVSEDQAEEQKARLNKVNSSLQIQANRIAKLARAQIDARQQATRDMNDLDVQTWNALVDTTIPGELAS